MEKGKFISSQKKEITFLKDCLTINNDIPEVVTKEPDEIQLVTDEHDFKYYESLPSDWSECMDFKEFYNLKDANKPWGKGNVTPKMEKPYLVHSPSSNVYWYRETHSNTNYLKLLKYKKDKNVYTRKENEV